MPFNYTFILLSVELYQHMRQHAASCQSHGNMLQLPTLETRKTEG